MLINYEGLAVNFEKKRIKNINLRIRRSGEIQITAPMRTSLQQIYQLLQTKLEWIKKHLNRLAKLQDEKVSPAGIYFLGQLYNLEIHELAAKKELSFSGDKLRLFLPFKPSAAAIQTEIKLWYQQEMQKLLPALFEKWEEIIQVKASKVSIKFMKSRWGSCNPISKQISLNLCLVEKPLIYLEYVIVHELVHLIEASHNKRFYAEMTKFMPNWKALRAAMRDQSRTSLRFQ